LFPAEKSWFNVWFVHGRDSRSDQLDVKQQLDGESRHRTTIVEKAHRVVVKLGTAVLTRDDGHVALSRLYSFVESIADLRKSGREVTVVSSGAVGLGSARLGLARGDQALPVKQASAAVGQGRLMALYSDAFDRLGIAAAQLLLTEEDFSNRRRYLNLRTTIAKLLELGAVPIVNENDTVSTVELEAVDAHVQRRVNFGDNDKLSALVASKTEADLLIILTDVEGLFTADPSGDEGAALIPVVARITPDLERAAGGARVGRGGMRTKLEAARIATRSGCAVVIASGRIPNVVERIVAGEGVGTLFLPTPGLSGRRRWIAFATTVVAELVVNDGARTALIQGRASLLAAGVTSVRGTFARGDVVGILDGAGREFARGIANYSSDEARALAGKHSDRIDDLVDKRNYDALITRDNIAIIEGDDHGDNGSDITDGPGDRDSPEGSTGGPEDGSAIG
jgi:glutamate 5-kinase